MKQFLKKINIETKRQFELVDITPLIEQAMSESGISTGLATVFNPHTTASIRLNHNEPLLIQDIVKTLYRLIPVDMNYSHDLFEIRHEVAVGERSNGHAHVKSFVMGASENIIIEQGKLLLGPKQSIFFVEFDGGRSRDFYVKIIGE